MTFVTSEVRTGAGTLSNWFAGLMSEIQDAKKRYTAYRTTFNELNAMSDRELTDIGISRVSVRDVARRAAEMA